MYTEKILLKTVRRKKDRKMKQAIPKESKYNGRHGTIFKVNKINVCRKRRESIKNMKHPQAV